MFGCFDGSVGLDSLIVIDALEKYNPREKYARICNGSTTTTETTTGEPVNNALTQTNLTFITFNALDNIVLPLVSISYNFQNNDPIQLISTDTNGRISITKSDVTFPFTFTYNATKEGFIPVDGTIRLNNKEQDHSIILSLTPILKQKQEIRLVMNWGRLPKDLDLHALQFSNSEPSRSCETYFGHKSGCDGLYLEVDNTKGGEHGAETITWIKPGDNWYLLYVFDYSGANTTLVKSEVRSW